MVYIGLDVGDKRVGISVSTTGLFAGGVETYSRRSLSADVEHISAIASSYRADCLVAGLPRHLDGRAHEQAEKNEILLQALRENGWRIEYWDERLSSAAAEAVMLEADISRKKRKENIDKLAAVVILQNYLDYINNGGAAWTTRK